MSQCTDQKSCQPGSVVMPVLKHHTGWSAPHAVPQQPGLCHSSSIFMIRYIPHFLSQKPACSILGASQCLVRIKCWQAEAQPVEIPGGCRVSKASQAEQCLDAWSGLANTTMLMVAGMIFVASASQSCACACNAAVSSDGIQPFTL